MKILIACEYSGIVRDAFIKEGHEAHSCDLLPCSSPGIHYIGDVRPLLSAYHWDMMIGFPPCTFLAKCQIAQTLNDKGRLKAAAAAYSFFLELYNAPIKHIALENPVGLLSTVFRKPDQIVQPWHFGDKHSKEICLWLKNLPPLISTVYHHSRIPVANHVNSRMSQALKSSIKSKFFPLVAQAMASQWSNI
jgi:hypothetical protein